jgi:hypothetical protein
LSISITLFTILASRFKEKLLEFDAAFVKQTTQIILTACFIFTYVAFFPFLKIFERQVKKRAEQKINLAFFDFKSPYKLEVRK